MPAKWVWLRLKGNLRALVEGGRTLVLYTRNNSLMNSFVNHGFNLKNFKSLARNMQCALSAPKTCKSLFNECLFIESAFKE